MLLKTIGDHIKKRRMDLKLLQKEVAEKIGVNEVTIYLWEKNRAEPSLAVFPKIIEFLGYNPDKEKPETLSEKIISFRRHHGLSQRKLAKLLEMDPATIRNWERGKHQPQERLLDKLFRFLPPC